MPGKVLTGEGMAEEPNSRIAIINVGHEVFLKPGSLPERGECGEEEIPGSFG
jgi:hypothetical protein